MSRTPIIDADVLAEQAAATSLEAGASGTVYDQPGGWNTVDGANGGIGTSSEYTRCEVDQNDDNISVSSRAKMIQNKTSCIDSDEIPNSLTKGAGQTTISFHGITYEVEQHLDDVPCCGKMGLKEILKDVSGLLTPGLNAIMGPTGSGKTSLLDILAKRKDPKGLKAGTVLVDGEKPPSNFRLMSGYVVQDDIVMGTLTVRENLAFSANLRLSHRRCNQKQRDAKVDQVIRQLGLQECAESKYERFRAVVKRQPANSSASKVGNEFIRGISGGERKRVNIGMELILDPPIIFLDEPTTGLDANTANSIVLLLHSLAREGRNIVLSIHQPRYSIFSLFDRLILLRLGRIVYRGQAADAVEHFASIGYPCPQFHNPADFFLDVVGGDNATAQLLGRMRSNEPLGDSTESNELSSALAAQGYNNGAVNVAVDIDCKEVDADEEGERLLRGYLESSMARAEESTLATILSNYHTKTGESLTLTTDSLGGQLREYPNGFFEQLMTVSGRTVRNIIRNPMTSVAQVILMVFFGVFMGLLYFQLDMTISGIQNRAGCFFFLIMMQVMSNLSALELFIKQRAHFIHESASGYYRVSVYFVSLVFADLIPNRLIPNLLFGSVIYFMIGFQTDAGKFFFFILTLVITAIAASSLAFLVSASVRVFALANILVAVPYLFMMMFGGFLANTTSLLDWLAWIKWISIFRYGINALTVNEMSGLVFINNSSYPGFDPDSEHPCLDNHFRPIPGCATGDDYMDSQGIPYGTAWDLWQNIVALACMAIGFLLLAYIQLRRIPKYK